MLQLRGGWALVRGLWLSWLQYRSFFFLLAFGWMIPPLIAMLVWMAAAGDGSLQGLNRANLAAYYLALILVNQVTYAQTNWTVGDLIRTGELNRVLLRPIPPLYDALASEFAGKVVYLVFDLPVVAVLAMILRPEMHWTLPGLLAFLPALVFAWALRFLWGYWLALLAFWTTRADALLGLQDTLVFLLAGQVAPLALLPPTMQYIAHLLPFRYMLAFPVEVLSGQMDTRQMFTGFAMQLAWLLFSALLTLLCWRLGVRRYTAVGG